LVGCAAAGALVYAGLALRRACELVVRRPLVKLGAKLTGGAVRIMISGAAPLPLYVQEFLLAACGGSVVQGYGMTENCANATIADLADYRSGHVGGPMPTMEIKLVDVPEMNYTSSGEGLPTGEVVTRGAPVFKGYHKNQEETDKVLTADGWLHTGDIGRWNADGTLSIIDRKKNIFKLAQGEYIAPEKIEMIVSKSKYVAQPWIYGNSFFPMLVAVVTPDWGELKQAAQAGGWFVDDQVALAAKPEHEESEHLVQGKPAVHTHRCLWAHDIAHACVHFSIHEPERESFITDYGLIVGLRVCHHLLFPAPVGQRVRNVAHVPTVVATLLQ